MHLGSEGAKKCDPRQSVKAISRKAEDFPFSVFHFPFSNCHLLLTDEQPRLQMTNDNWKMENLPSSTNLACLMGPKALAENLFEYLAGPAFW